MTFGGGGLYHMILWHFGVLELGNLCFYPTDILEIQNLFFSFIKISKSKFFIFLNLLKKACSGAKCSTFLFALKKSVVFKNNQSSLCLSREKVDGDKTLSLVFSYPYGISLRKLLPSIGSV